jgi:hypothetical protein
MVHIPAERVAVLGVRRSRVTGSAAGTTGTGTGGGDTGGGGMAYRRAKRGGERCTTAFGEAVVSRSSEETAGGRRCAGCVNSARTTTASCTKQGGTRERSGNGSPGFVRCCGQISTRPAPAATASAIAPARRGGPKRPQVQELSAAGAAVQCRCCGAAHCRVLGPAVVASSGQNRRRNPGRGAVGSTSGLRLAASGTKYKNKEVYSEAPRRAAPTATRT